MKPENKTNTDEPQSRSTAGLDASDDAKKQAFVAAQFRETMQGNIPQVTCGCGLKMPLRFAFKCVYCCEYYCQSCAETHFGKRRCPT